MASLIVINIILTDRMAHITRSKKTIDIRIVLILLQINSFHTEISKSNNSGKFCDFWSSKNSYKMGLRRYTSSLYVVMVVFFDCSETATLKHIILTDKCVRIDSF